MHAQNVKEELDFQRPNYKKYTFHPKYSSTNPNVKENIGTCLIL